MAGTTGPGRKIIGSVQKAVDILNLFDSQHQELGITDIAEALNHHKSTVSSLVHTLESNGYLEQNPENRKYRLGLKLVERATVLLDQIKVREVALPYLEQLSEWCNETVNLAIPDRRHVVYIERLLGTQSLGMRVDVGKRAPVHCTALGKAMLAMMPVPEVKALLDNYELKGFTASTITDLQVLMEDLQTTRERGYALDDEEYDLGARCVAAPILDHMGKPVAAVSVSVPLVRIPRDKISYFGARVRDTARQISSNLGYYPQY
jgi:IclR family KDG regulon transcriptional repressor